MALLRAPIMVVEGAVGHGGRAVGKAERVGAVGGDGVIM